MAMNKIPEGGRNNSMFHFGVYAKKNGLQNGRVK